MQTNRHQKWIDLAHAVDQWRIFPRAFLSVYIFLLYYATMWFMDLPDPSLEQSGLISVIVGAGAAWFGLYAGTHKAPTAGLLSKQVIQNFRMKASKINIVMIS